MKQILNIDERGFTLIEAVVAMFVLVVGVFAMYTMHLTSVNGNFVASDLTRASTWAADKIEDLINESYDDLLDGANGNGTNQDPDWNGLDEIGLDNDFGLGDLGAAADGSENSPDGRYTISWNVAMDHPMPNLKMIRINVQYLQSNQQKVVSMNYIIPST